MLLRSVRDRGPNDTNSLTTSQSPLMEKVVLSYSR